MDRVGLSQKRTEQRRRKTNASPASQTIARRVKVKRKGLSILLFLGVSIVATCSESQPVSSAQLMAWLTAGVPCNRLVRLVQERGMATALGKEQLRQFESAGADAKLIHVLTNVKLTASAASSIAASTSEIPAALVRAALDAHAGHFHEAEQSLREALKSDPQNGSLHFALGAMLRQQERWDDAFDEVAAAAQAMPDLPENHSSFAYIFYRLDDGANSIAEARSTGQYPAAVHAYMESLARDENNPDTYYDLGIALHAGGNITAAISAYRRAIQLKPAFWQAHSNLALIFHEKNQFDEAIGEYREAKRLAPEDASVRYNLGNTYCDKGEFDAAMSELRELYRQHPEWEQGHTCMARGYLAKKDYPSAIDELKLAVRQNPGSSSDHRALGEAMLLNDKLEEGVHELRLAVTLNPDSDAAHRALGTALFRQQQLNAAEKEFREALRLNSSPDNHYALAACLMTMDRYEEALSELEVAARLDPERQLYRARRDELLKLMKETNSR
jgi:tetratricopeptide (TPR) repeat protein